MYENQWLVVSFIVANTKGPNLLERDVLKLLRLKWGKIVKCLLCRRKCKN